MDDKLISSEAILTEQEVDKYLNTKYIGRNILHFDSINSTNTKAKELANDYGNNGTLVISEEQTLGRGRFGRQWASPKFKGIWMSIILKPKVDPTKASNITLIGAAAVVEAFKEFGVKANIKWPNDIILNEKKIGGVLTEMASKLNLINYIVMGIGINVNVASTDFLPELKSIATSLSIETGEEVPRAKLLGGIVNHFESLYEEYINENNLNPTLDICRASSNILGKEIQLYIKGSLFIVKALDIDQDGLLVIKHGDGKIEKIMSGEVSMHGR